MVFFRNNRVKITLIIAMSMVIFSELGRNFMLAGFRISLSVVLLPLFLLTIAKDISVIRVCGVTALLVLCYRVGVDLLRGAALSGALLAHFPAALFYLVYGLLFRRLVPLRYHVADLGMLPRLMSCEFAANVVEALVKILLQGTLQGPTFFMALVAIAAGRAVLSLTLLLLYHQYSDLLRRAEHEERYQRLFMMKTELKTELYFMKKSSQDIEESVKNAYTLYEKLVELDVPQEVRHTARQIACDIHDIKKDYLRITKGIQEEIGEDKGSMHIFTLMRILRDSTGRMLEQAGHGKIRLDFSVRDDFTTECHYQLMSILRCLVNNAIEAIESAGIKANSTVTVTERRDGDTVTLEVSDNGPGIPPEALGKIFRMGYSTKFNEKTGDIYRGMGLTGVKLCVEEQLKGEIEVQSTPGVKTAFIVRIPAESVVSENSDEAAESVPV